MATTGLPLSLPKMAPDGERRPETVFNAAMEILNAWALSRTTLYSSLVSYWKMDETSGTRDDAYGSNDLTDNNTVTSATGVRTNAAHFVIANSEFLSKADNATLDFSAAFTLSVWIKQTALAVNQTIAAKWTYQTQGSWGFQTDATNNDELLCYIATSLIDAGVNYGRTTTADLAAGTWYHLIVVYDGSGAANADRLKIYVNGVQKTLTFTGTIPASLQNSTADLNVGKFGGSLTQYYGGDMDLFGLWSRAVTAAEIAELYSSGAGWQP